MASLNQVSLIGNLGDEPKMSTAQSGNQVANIRLATTDKGYVKQDGTKVEDKTEWHNVVFFGKTAEVVSKYCHKGSSIFVQGKLRTREYEKDGQKRYITEIVGDTLQLLGSKAENAPQGLQMASTAIPQTPQAQPAPVYQQPTYQQAPPQVPPQGYASAQNWQQPAPRQPQFGDSSLPF